MIIAGITTIPGREESLKDTLESLSPQVDHIYLCVSHEYVFQNGLPENVIVFYSEGTDERKFLGCAGCSEHDTFFVCDDDIIYPPDFVQKTVEGLKDYPIVTHQGRAIKSPLKTYYKSNFTRYYPFLDQHDKNAFCNVPGTGVTAFRLKDICPTMADFPIEFARMADIHFGILAQKLKLPIKVLTHDKGWLKHTDKIDMNNTIWAESQGREQKIVQRVNSIKWEVYK